MPRFENNPDMHGFVLMGMSSLYIDHLPMFNMQDHCYHAIFEIEIPEDAKLEYLADKEKNPNNFYILGNLNTDLFTLPSIVTGDKVAFQADIFNYLPEDPDRDPPLIHNITVNIKRTIRMRHFDFCFDYPPLYTYVIFGNENEAFLSHYLSKLNDFMHVCQLSSPPEWLSLELLKYGMDINFMMHNDPDLHYPPFESGRFDVMVQGLRGSISPIHISHNIFFSHTIPNMHNA